MYLEIVSPEAILYKGNVNSVTVPGILGEFQMLESHAAIVSLLGKGHVKINGEIDLEAYPKFEQKQSSLYWLAINSGTVEIKNDKIIVLVE